MLFKDNNYITVSSMDELLSHTVLLKVVRQHKTVQQPRLKKLLDYYKGDNTEILKKAKDITKPDNRVTNAFGRIIVEQITNVFASNPVKYQSEDTTALLELEVVNAMNEESYHTYNLAKDASIFGIAAELLYTDNDAEIRFAKLDPTQVIPVYSTGVNVNLIGAIRYYSVQSLADEVEDREFIEVYDAETIRYYENVGGALKLYEEVQHYFKQCPINIYNSGEHDLSDIEPVIELINAYDRLMSDTQNLYDYFSDSYLLLKGAEDTDPTEFQAMKQNRVIVLPEGGDANFITKQTDSASLSDQFDRIKDNIFKFSFVVPIEEQVFGSDISGISLKYRLQMLEGLIASRERLFTQAIKRRIQMIYSILAVKGKHYNASDISIKFTRNVPNNDSEMIANATALTGIVSNKTILSMLPNVDVELEMKRIEDEKVALNTVLDPYANATFEQADDETEIPAVE